MGSYLSMKKKKKKALASLLAGIIVDLPQNSTKVLRSGVVDDLQFCC